MKKPKRETRSYLKLNSYKFGLTGGVIGTLCIMLTTLFGIMNWLGGLKLWTEIIANIYSGIGYKVTWLGMLLGGIYGFIDFFIMAWIFAVIYNKLS